MSVDYAERFPSLAFDRPTETVLRITLDAPGLNAVSPAAHGELADIWPVIDRDDDVARRRHPGGGQGVLRRRQLRADRRDHPRRRVARPGDARGARPGVQRDRLLQADRLGDPRTGGRRRPGGGRARRRVDRRRARHGSSTATPASAWPPATTRPSAGRCSCGMAKAKYYLLTCDTLTGEEAERIGLVSLCVDDDQVHAKALEVAERLAGMAQESLRLHQAGAAHVVPDGRPGVRGLAGLRVPRLRRAGRARGPGGAPREAAAELRLRPPVRANLERTFDGASAHVAERAGSRHSRWPPPPPSRRPRRPRRRGGAAASGPDARAHARRR